MPYSRAAACAAGRGGSSRPARGRIRTVRTESRGCARFCGRFPSPLGTRAPRLLRRSGGNGMPCERGAGPVPAGRRPERIRTVRTGTRERARVKRPTAAGMPEEQEEPSRPRYARAWRRTFPNSGDQDRSRGPGGPHLEKSACAAVAPSDGAARRDQRTAVGCGRS